MLIAIQAIIILTGGHMGRTFDFTKDTLHISYSEVLSEQVTKSFGQGAEIPNPYFPGYKLLELLVDRPHAGEEWAHDKMIEAGYENGIQCILSENDKGPQKLIVVSERHCSL